MSVERSKGREGRHRRQEGQTAELHQRLDIPLVIASAGAAIAVLEDEVTDRPREGQCPLAPPIRQDPLYRQLHVVEQHRLRHPAEEAECRGNPVKQRFLCLGPVSLQIKCIRVWQVAAEHVQLQPLATDDAYRLAKVDLRVSRRMGQWNEHLPPPRLRPAHVVAHRRIVTREAVLVTQALPDTLCRMPLLRRGRVIAIQNGVNHAKKRSDLRTIDRFGPHIAGRRRIPAHLRNAVPADPQLPRYLAPALALQQHKLPNGRVYLHAIHPRTVLPAYTKRTILPVAGFYAALQRHNGAAPLALFATALNIAA
jgi:hypothetical protein